MNPVTGRRDRLAEEVPTGPGASWEIEARRQAIMAEQEGRPIRLWHDDIRQAPDGWVWARRNETAKAILETGLVTEASLDHDLGLHGLDPSEYESPEVLVGDSPDGDGRDLCRWMVREGRVPDRVTIHSFNPPGAKEMAAILREGSSATVIVRPYTGTES